jgi:hypothetical protein
MSDNEATRPNMLGCQRGGVGQRGRRLWGYKQAVVDLSARCHGWIRQGIPHVREGKSDG